MVRRPPTATRTYTLFPSPTHVRAGGESCAGRDSVPLSGAPRTTLHFAAAAMRPARSSIRAASCGLLLISLTQSQSRWMRKQPVLAAAASANVDDTQCILDLQKRRTVSTRPCTMGHGVRGHRRADEPGMAGWREREGGTV